MSFYDNDNSSWSAPGRQPSWEQQKPAPPSRTSTASSLSQQPEPTAFASQFEEIERATDNLIKSGKWYPNSAQAAAGPGRRDSMPTTSRNFEYNDARAGGPPPRHQSVSEYESGRPGSAGLQGFYAGQRFPGGRQSEAEQVLQSKRRMAAQRERELRNYHQEQQYNRTVTGAKTDRAMSPNTMSEEDRRDLIARQHRALYGDNSSLYTGDGNRAPSQDARGSTVGPGQPSPLAYDPYSAQAQGGAESAVQMPPRERPENTASPVGNAPGQQSAFGLINDAQNARTSSSSPGNGSPPLASGSKGGIGSSGVAPIGTRPTQQNQGPPGGLNKRSTTPLTPSSLSYGFNASDAQGSRGNPINAGGSKDERSASSAPNPNASDKPVSGLGSWANTGGVWGASKNLAVQPSVWG